MERGKDIPKIQHYVPQFILRNFSVGKKPQVFVFDKSDNRIFKTNIRNVASETGFYNFEIDEKSYSIETQLSKLEKISSQVVNKIARFEKISGLTESERLYLSMFIAVQLTRTLHSRQFMKHAYQDLEKKLRSVGAEPLEVKGFYPLTDDDIKRITIHTIANADEFVPHIRDKIWLLLKASKSDPFYISDNPVTMQTLQEFGYPDKVGLAVEGIEIYMPLSSQLTLAMYCKSYEKKILEAYTKFKIVSIVKPELAKLKDLETISIEALMRGFETGCVVPCSSENIVNLNSLQVAYSSRFIYSSTRNFDLALDMINENEKYRRGPRATLQ